MIDTMLIMLAMLLCIAIYWRKCKTDKKLKDRNNQLESENKTLVDHSKHLEFENDQLWRLLEELGTEKKQREIDTVACISIQPVLVVAGQEVAQESNESELEDGLIKSKRKEFEKLYLGEDADKNAKNKYGR